MYDEHFGLDEPPFRITPDTRLFFPGGSRGAILDAIVYAITSGEGILKVVGEVGSGKTMLCRMLELKLPSSVEVVYLANPSLSPDNILHAIAFEMGLSLPAGAGRLEVMHALHARLLEKHADNRQVVVFVEEAQRMPLETLEEVRLLSNLETERSKLLQIVLFGQPELERNLRPTHIRQLKERITHTFHLPRLSAAEIREYLDFRMRSAGYRGPPVFSGAAVRRIGRASQGLIRRINILADKALLAAFAAGVHRVTPRQVRTALRDSEFGRTRFEVDWRVAGGFAAGIAATGVAWAVQMGLVGWPGSPAEPVAPAEMAAVATEEPRAEAGTAASGPPPSREVGFPATAVLEPAASDSTVAFAPSRTGPMPSSTPGSALVVASDPRAGTGGPEKADPAAVATDAASAGVAEAGPAVAPEASPGPTEATGAPVAPMPTAVAPKVANAGSGRQAGPGLDGEESDVAHGADGPVGPYLTRRLAATEQWLRGVQAGAYSVQLMHIAVDRGATLEASLRRGGLGGEMDRVWVYRTRIRGDDLLSVLLGEYPSYEDARRAVAALPAGLRQAKPFVRSLREIRGDSAGPSG
jgi:type II secretory pathway predicted ATPase ExeA